MFGLPIVLVKNFYEDEPGLGMDVLNINTAGPSRFQGWSEQPSRDVVKTRQKRKIKKSMASESRRRNRRR